jgi:hypothetical protein
MDMSLRKLNLAGLYPLSSLREGESVRVTRRDPGSLYSRGGLATMVVRGQQEWVILKKIQRGPCPLQERGSGAGRQG